MKKKLLTIVAAITCIHFASGQTKTVTVDANDALNNNTKIVAQTTIGQSFFVGHQLGSSYAYQSAGIFRAWTDQPLGSANYYYDGVTNGTTNFSVRAIIGGNVGIGTTDTKGYKFAVNGNAIATSMTVKLYTNWPDYVFKSDYELPALTSIKTYIDQNHHLPEIPCEAEVAKDGVNLGEMNRLLLKKVEELTLYLIEKDKKEKEQDVRIQKLENAINNKK